MTKPPASPNTPPMPATPAWPPQSTPRLFLEAMIAPDAAIRIDGAKQLTIGRLV